jgi:hypothetical protein
MKRVLSVDWDFFFPVPDADPQVWALYDWGHREAPFFITSLWYSRGSGFLINGLPLPGLSGEEKTFWNRFDLSQVGAVQVAESHSQLVELISRRDEIVNYDAHHDAGYGGRKYEDTFEVTCEDWGRYAAESLNCQVKTVYPRWRKDLHCCDETEPESKKVEIVYDDGQPDPESFDEVFVCRSGAWVPSWLDDQFDRFLKASGLEIQEMEPLLERAWSEEKLTQDVAQYKMLLEVAGRGK